ncbi:MAG TPA: hypothetical protein VIV11_37045 [Kofleriaceae bacterium]
MLHALLLECRVLALALGGFCRLDTHTRFALGTELGFFDRPVVITLRLDACFFRFATETLGLLLRTNPCLFGTTDRVFLFLDAVLLDLTELAQREQN